MRADVREIGLLRVAQVAHQRAGRGDRRLPPLEAEALEAAARAADRAASAAPISSSKCQPSISVTGSAELRDLRDGRARRRSRVATTISRGRSTASSSPQRLQPVGARVLGDVELAGREVEQRDAVLGGAVPRAGGRDDRHQERRLARVEVAASVSVPGDTTRTTSRLTTPLAFCGSSTCSQIATR